MKEDWYSIKTRVNRLDTEYAWAEDPPTRTRHFITNVRVDDGEEEGGVRVRSNVLVYWAKGSTDAFKLLSGERHDVLTRIDGRWKLTARKVLLDHTVLVTQNLSIFL
jgi:3-phenylpropionate/cinnamic acid dioxygenase small subunit